MSSSKFAVDLQAFRETLSCRWQSGVPSGRISQRCDLSLKLDRTLGLPQRPTFLGRKARSWKHHHESWDIMRIWSRFFSFLLLPWRIGFESPCYGSVKIGRQLGNIFPLPPGSLWHLGWRACDDTDDDSRLSWVLSIIVCHGTIYTWYIYVYIYIHVFIW